MFLTYKGVQTKWGLFIDDFFCYSYIKKKNTIALNELGSLKKQNVATLSKCQIMERFLVLYRFCLPQVPLVCALTWFVCIMAKITW